MLPSQEGLCSMELVRLVETSGSNFPVTWRYTKNDGNLEHVVILLRVGCCNVLHD